jgi:outer membrane immunogenic protein
MRRTAALWGSVALFALSSFLPTASAADLPRPVYKAQPGLYNPAPIFTWTGFYVGAHAGYGWSKFDGTGTFGASSVNAKGFLGGAQLGYNYQINQFVVGVEGEYSWANVKYDTPLFAGTLTLKNDYFADVALRLGYAIDRTLIYGKVGAAWTRDKWDGNDGTGGTVTGNFSRHGWLLGAGVEYAFWNNWSAKLEYNYLMFGTIMPTLTTTGTLTVAGTSDVKLNTHIVKAGINYRFGPF